MQHGGARIVGVGTSACAYETAMTLDMTTETEVSLGTAEQQRLVAAIAGAIEVRSHPQFHAWLRGPFRSLLPHRCVVCLEIDGSDAVRHVECLCHDAEDGDPAARHAHRDAAVHAVRDCHRSGTLHSVANSLETGAVVHGTRFLSGATYYVVLFDVPADVGERSGHLLKLLSSHLKMVLARVVRLPRDLRITPREHEILGWMRHGCSNQEISALLGISALTLKNHVRKIYRKLDVTSRSEAVLFGLSDAAAAAIGRQEHEVQNG